MSKRKVLLDVDTGTDDAIAVMLAALHPALDLIACTTVNGNVDVQQATNNTLRVLEFVGRADIPVYVGLHRPLVRRDFPIPRSVRNVVEYIHGNELPLPETRLTPANGHAVEFLIETFRAATDEITLVALGPLSNVAASVALAPDFVDRVPELVVMGGAHAIGNVTPSAGFNTWSDPESAASVIGAGFRRITMVPIDATHQALITRADCAALRQRGGIGEAAARIIERRIDGYETGQPMAVPDSAPLHDPLCVAYLVDPLVITTRLVHVAVETTGALTLGRTVMDVSNRSGLPANCHVAFRANGRAFIELLFDVLITHDL